MENIIKKAIEGGYTWEVRGTVTRSEAILDQLFWQALGKACGWSEFYREETGYSEWLHNAIKFHEINLTQGWDKAVEYLEDLIK